MKRSDDNFINGANPAGVRNEMEIIVLIRMYVARDRQQPGLSKNAYASVCAVQELKITSIHPSNV